MCTSSQVLRNGCPSLQDTSEIHRTCFNLEEKERYAALLDGYLRLPRRPLPLYNYCPASPHSPSGSSFRISDTLKELRQIKSRLNAHRHELPSTNMARAPTSRSAQSIATCTSDHALGDHSYTDDAEQRRAAAERERYQSILDKYLPNWCKQDTVSAPLRFTSQSVVGKDQGSVRLAPLYLYDRLRESAPRLDQTKSFANHSHSNVQLDPVESLLATTKRSLEAMAKFSTWPSKPVLSDPSSGCRLRNGHFSWRAASVSPEVISLEADEENMESGKDTPTSIDHLTSYPGTSHTQIAPFPRSKDFDQLTEKFKIDPSRVCSHVRSDYTETVHVRKNEAEKLLLEAKFRLEARCTRKRDSLEDEVKLGIRLEGLVLPETEEEEEADFSPLTDAQLSQLSRVLSCNEDRLLIEKFSIPIKRRDLATLTGLNWLNDEVINFYFNLIAERSGQNGLAKVYAFSTFFYQKLVQGGHAGLKRWTRKVDIFRYDLLLVPVHLGVHWCLAVIDLRKQAVEYFDSMGGGDAQCTRSLIKYLADECYDKKKTMLDTSVWKEVTRKDIPHQMNGSDCGVFTCKFGDYASRDAKINFSQENMPYFRQRIMLEILSGHLL